MTTTEHAAQIRSELKKRHGWTSRQISVRADYFSLGSALEIHVKDPAIPLSAVKAVAEPSEHIRRCEITGDILGGGNRYLHVSYTRQAQETIGRRWEPAVRAAVDGVVIGSNVLLPIGDTDFLVGREHEFLISLWDRKGAGCLTQGGNVEQIAQSVGNLMVEREAVTS
jgi:hypothetical protein